MSGQTTHITDLGQFKHSEQDTGSSEVQVALLTGRIKHLTEHFKSHKGDLHSKYGLQKLVSRRRKLLVYLKRNQPDHYRRLIEALNLRDSY